MVLSPTIERELEAYGDLVYYDKYYSPLRMERGVRSGQTLPGSSSVLQEYTETLVQLLRLAETTAFSATPIKWVTKEPSDEELWMSLIGIFESGDPHFAERHDQMYG